MQHWSNYIFALLGTILTSERRRGSDVCQVFLDKNYRVGCDIKYINLNFVSIPNFTEFYSEDVNKGMECIRLLNEIIGE